jgi:hypothetical protein
MSKKIKLHVCAEPGDDDGMDFKCACRFVKHRYGIRLVSAHRAVWKLRTRDGRLIPNSREIVLIRDPKKMKWPLAAQTLGARQILAAVLGVQAAKARVEDYRGDRGI